MATRNRTTWAAGKNAGQAPAAPGYGTADQDHPAYQPEPAHDKYEKGNPDAWASTPNPAPYPEGNPPSVPGYDTEDQDHPAYKRAPRVEKLSSLVEKKAAKALVIAQRMLGKNASTEAVELQALDLMDWDDRRIESTLERLGGGFLAEDMDMMAEEEEACGDYMGMEEEPMMSMEEEPMMSMEEPMMSMEEPMMSMEELMSMEEMMGMHHDKGPMAMFASALTTLAKEVRELKASQNAYPGPTLGGPAKDEAAARAEALECAKGEARAAFDRMDTDGDGFIVASEFDGNKAIFAAIDVDADGIITKAEYVAAMASDEEEKEAEDEAEDMEKKANDEMLALLASLDEEELDSLHKAAGDDDDDDDDDAEEEAEESDEDEAADKEAAAIEAGCEKLPEGPMRDNCEEKSKEASDDEEKDAEEEEAEKEASFFTAGGDPMGLDEGKGGIHMTAEDEEVLNSIFAADVPTASQTPVELNPQPKQASTGSTAAVGNMTRTASNGVGDLSELWESAPDVSKVFNN